MRNSFQRDVRHEAAKSAFVDHVGRIFRRILLIYRKDPYLLPQLSEKRLNRGVIS